MSNSGPSVEQRVVEMDFKSASFINNVSKTIEALGRLKGSLNFGGAERSLDNLDQAGRRFSAGGLSNIGKSVEHVASRFSAMGVIGFTVLSNLTNRALDAGISIVKGFTLDPIRAGLDVYETKINAIQTILANTAAQGTKLPQVTAALNELNKYANLTVYNFGEMTKNIGTFTAAGVDLNTSVSSIKGIANLAALSGASSQQASTGMYQLSQAIAAGTVKLQDWNSVVNAGFGGKVFQNALINTARAQGVSVDAEIKKFGSFRQSLQSGWLTAKVLTDTLKTFTGDLSASQIKAMGFTDAQTKAIMNQAKLAVNSATQIRTVTQLTQALKEEVATAYSHVWETLIGNIGGATKTLTLVHNVLENLFTKPIYDLNAFLQEFIKLGGRTALLTGLTNAFRFLMAIIRPIKEAFRDVFPPLQVATLVALAYRFELFTDKLVIGWRTQEKIRSSFEGLFSILKIGLDVILGVGHGLGIVFHAIQNGTGGVLGATAATGNFLTNLRKTIEAGGFITKFFTVLGNIIAFPIKLIEKLTSGMNIFSVAFDKAGKVIKPVGYEIGKIFKDIGTFLGNALNSGALNNLAHLFDQILLGGVLVSIRKFIGSLGGKKEPGGGLFSTIKESFEQLTNTLHQMQTNLKVDTLLKIAAAVALLAASIVAMSLINVENLTKALSAMTVMFTEMVAAFAIVTKIADAGGIFKMTAAGVALNLLATSILILSGAVVILSKLSWQELARGLSAVTALLIVTVGAANLLGKNAKGAIAGAYSIQVMAIAMNIMAEAVEKLGGMNIPTLAKGVGSIAAILIVMAGFNKLSGDGAGLIKTAASMVIIGTALNIIARAVEALGKLPMGTLAKGIGAIAASLIIIAGAMHLMPPDMIVTSAALLLVATSLTILADALVKMGGMSWGEIARGLVVLAGSLVLIVAAMIGMTEALPGAAALFVVATALAVLTPVLKALGDMSWGEILKGLVTLAGVFAILGVAGLVLAPVVPVLLALGGAIALIGIGVLAAGLGVAAFAVGLTALAVAGGAAITVLVGGVIALSETLPTVGKNIGLGLVALAKTIATAGPAILGAIAAVLTALLGAIIKVAPKAGKAFIVVMDVLLGAIQKEAPKIIKTFANLILTLLNALANYYPKFVAAGIRLIANVLNGIAQKIGSVIAAGANIVIALVAAIAAQTLRVVHAAALIIIHFVNALADEIRRDAPQLRAAALNLANAIIDGLLGGLASKAGNVASAAWNMGKSALNWMMKAVGANSPAKEFAKIGVWSGMGYVLGLLSHIPHVEVASTSVGKAALDALGKSLSNASDVVSANMDLSPRITPVIDLTEAQKGFSALSGMSNKALQLNSSTNKATAISAANAASAAAITTQHEQAQSANTLNYTQNNYSPKALDELTIYRQTKNQLSTVKDAIP